jgi:hypothetical protein
MRGDWLLDVLSHMRYGFVQRNFYNAVKDPTA